MPVAVEVALDRIESADGAVGAFVAEPRRRARVMGAAARVGAGPLHRAPVAVKDLFRVERLPTRAGSRLPAELFAGPQSRVVSALVDAGAVIVGKTAMDEFGYAEPAATKNPRDLSRTPGGSSGGSAAAVAAGMVSMAVGSQTLQSTIGPAAFCGVVGFKPTFGRVPFDGVPLAPSLDTVGLLGTDLPTVADLAAIIVPGWRSSPPTRLPVFGVCRSFGLARHAEGWAGFDGHRRRLADRGVQIEVVTVPWARDAAGWGELILDLVHAEMAAVHRPWFDRYQRRYRPRTAAAIRRGSQLPPGRLEECRDRRSELRQALVEVAAAAGIDAWLCPSAAGVAPVGYDKTGDPWLTGFWSYAGLPCLSLPVLDDSDGRPLGVQIVGHPDRDEQLLADAGSVEDAVNPRP